MAVLFVGEAIAGAAPTPDMLVERAAATARALMVIILDMRIRWSGSRRRVFVVQSVQE